MAPSYDKPTSRPNAHGFHRAMPLLDLFPQITPYSSGFLELDHGHQMYWEQSGNPDGTPIVLLHGGPGGSSAPAHRRFFDPDHYRIILYDQRGSGRSSLPSSIDHNTPDDLVADLECLRNHLKIDRWHLFGSSWGSTLALLYASVHSDRCISMILSAVFLMEKEEIDWFLYGIKNFFPESWDQFAQYIPENERNDLLAAYHKRLFSDDEKTAIDAAIRWCLYESACATLIPSYETITSEEQRRQVLSLARLECHYFKNFVLSDEQSLLRRVDKFRHIPAVIIKGRYDMLCPLITAHRLHQAWPEADYVVVPDAGHSEQDPPIRSRLIESTENAKTLS